MLNSEYKLSESSIKPPQLAKSYQKTLSNHGIHCPILILVPSETLTAITSYLDPPSLLALAVVNIYLNGHVKDDNTWRRAFFYQFLGIGPENDLDDNKALLLKRTEGSWRNEFTVRYKLKRRWERSRSVVTTHVPFGSPISSMHVMQSHALLTSSIQYGTVTRSYPLTGRILPGYLDASGGARLGNGNPNPELIPEISACAISSDGGTAKIVWGTIAGDVLFMIAPRVMDGSRRDTSFQRCDIADKHNGSVLDVQWAVNVPTAALAWVIVTASADGRVKLWDAKSAVCQWTSQRTYNTVIPDPCIKVAANGACIAAVMKSGEIHVWTGFALGSIATYEGSFIRETIIECPISTSTQEYDSQATHAVTALYIDPNPTSVLPTLLVAYEHDPFFYRIRVGSQTRTGPEENSDVDITVFGDPFFGSTSIVVPYFGGTAEHQASFVFVGDHLGWVSLYAWDADNPSTTATTSIQPVRKFEAHHDSVSITALTWSPYTLMTGSAKGTTHVFDALSFRHLKSFFASPIPKTRGRHQAGDAEAERERRKVKQIIVGNGPGGGAPNLSSMEDDRDLVFISVGERVMAWKAGPVAKHLHGGVRGRHIHGELGKKKRVGYAKYLQQLEVNQTILESRHDHHQLLLEESRYKKSRTSNFSEYAKEREREQRERLEHLGLSEVEAVEYVLMLSRDEANANARTETGSGSSDIFETHLEKEDQGVFEGDFDMEQNTDDDDDDVRPSFTHSTVSGSRRSSTSSTSIPTAWSSSNSSLSSSSASLSSRSSHSNLTTVTKTIAMRPILSSSNEKIQVSPPFKAEPMEAGEEWLVDYNAAESSSISSSGDTNIRMGAEMEAHIFPPIRNAGNEVHNLQKDDEKVGKKEISKGKKKRNKKSRNNIEDTRKDMPQGRDKATGVEIPYPTPSSLASTSARNIPLSTSQNQGQRRTSNISNFSSPSTSASATTAPRNAWTSGGPSLSARISPPTVAVTGSLYHHHQQKQGGGHGANFNMDMDEDLRLAIELSLVEARSRGDDV